MIVTLEELEHDFKPVQIEDWPWIQEYLCMCQYEESNHNIVNLMMWLDWYPVFYCRTEKYLLLLVIHEGEFFMYMPLCKPEDFSDAILKGKQIFDCYGYPFRMTFVTEDQKNRVLEILPNAKAELIRDFSDYIYEVEKMKTLSGKALQKKRNHLNAFYRENEGHWTYESLNEENVEECRSYLQQWKDEEDEKFEEEKKGVECILDNFGKVPYKGGLIRIDGEVKAFAIGTRLSDRMCQENIEKADDTVRGLYQAIMAEFLKHEFSDYTYVNREDDFGEENLRHAKESLKPVFMIDKYNIVGEKA